MKDYSNIKATLLNEYIKEFNPSSNESDAFLKGVNWFIDSISDENEPLNNSVPENSIIKHLDKQLKKFTFENEALVLEIKHLNNEAKRLKSLSCEEKKYLKGEDEYKRLKQEIHELQRKVHQIKADYNILFNKYSTINSNINNSLIEH